MNDVIKADEHAKHKLHKYVMVYGSLGGSYVWNPYSKKGAGHSQGLLTTPVLHQLTKAVTIKAS